MEYFVNSQEASFVIETTKRDISEEIVDRLVKCRKLRKMTQQDIADKTGIARANVARIENCKYTPTIEVLVRYALAVGMRLTFSLEEAEDQRVGRNKETLVDSTYIESGEYRRKFDSITDSSELNRLMYSKAKEMLNHRNGTEYEDMYWFDYDQKDVLCSKLDELNKGEIRHTRAIDTKLKKTGKVVAVHTHPHSMPPSPEDFNCYLAAGYCLGVVICHNGTIYKYKAFSPVDTELWTAYVMREMKQGADHMAAQWRALKKFELLGLISCEEVLP